MVRFKNRYLLCELQWEGGNGPGVAVVTGVRNDDIRSALVHRVREKFGPYGCALVVKNIDGVWRPLPAYKAALSHASSHRTIRRTHSLYALSALAPYTAHTLSTTQHIRNTRSAHTQHTQDILKPRSAHTGTTHAEPTYTH